MAQLPLDVMKLSADTIRTLAMDAVQKANSGHPGMPMGTADLAVVLWSRYLKHNPQDPNWLNRDRFILSAGHGSMLIYALLHLSGYDLPMEEIKNFRQWGSKTPGHPEYGYTPGVETTTGPLGQGITNAVGFALAEAHLGAKYNRDEFNVVDHYTYVIASDGDLMEGVSHEASSLAGHFGLNKLIVLYDDNKITIDGTTDLAFTEDVMARYEAYGWHTQKVAGHDMAALDAAIAAAQAETDKPSIIACRTHIGFGSPNKQDTSKAHGSPLGDAEIARTKAQLGWTHDAFTVPDDVYAHMAGSAESQTAWQTLFDQYAAAHPALAAELLAAYQDELPSDWQNAIPTFEVGNDMATRDASGKVLAGLVPVVTSLVGGSADLTGSNKTWVDGMGHVQKESYANRYVNYGVREHGMAGMMNGMALHGGIRPYSGTFLVFSDYMRGSMRLSALMHQPVIYVLSHDSIGVGEDGPTHQPVEHLMALRTIPNMWVARPGDANEVGAVWQMALERKDGPTVIVLSRQKTRTNGPAATAGATHGGYVLSDHKNAQAILMATGTEVEIAMDAQALLANDGIATRVVSIPCWELFDQQSAEYKESVLPGHLTARVAIEAGVTLGWQKYVGAFGKIMGIDHFGASAPYQTIYKEFGLTAEDASQAVKSLLS